MKPTYFWQVGSLKRWTSRIQDVYYDEERHMLEKKHLLRKVLQGNQPHYSFVRQSLNSQWPPTFAVPDCSGFFVRGVNEPAGGVIFFRGHCLLFPFPFNAFPDTFLCVFFTQRPCTATYKTLFIQRAEWDVFGSSFFKSSPFDFITFGSHQKQKFFVSGSRLDAEIDVLSDLRFPCRTALLRLPFFVFFATPGTWNDDGKIVFLAQFVPQFPDVVIGLCAVVIFVVFDVVSGTKNDKGRSRISGRKWKKIQRGLGILSYGNLRVCLWHKCKFCPCVMTWAVLAMCVFDTPEGCVGILM